MVLGSRVVLGTVRRREWAFFVDVHVDVRTQQATALSFERSDAPRLQRRK